MHATDFGRTLIIANPAAQSGAAREVAERLQRFLDMTARASQFDLVLTEHMGHAKELAAQTQGYRTVIALGGDGVIHEVVNGLMTQKEDARPALAVLPVGSGNDFAQTLDIEDFSGKDFGALLTCELQRQDIGRIRSWNPASGSGEAIVEYYDQTLSVGIDAAIGLGTTELRKKTGLTGAPLYTLSGLEQFGLRYRNYPMTVSFDGAPAERVRAIIMAIQLGPTYGSGYRICPDADPCDGMLDVCYACGPVPRAVALPMFLSAKDGHHTKLPPVRMRRCRHAELTFEEPDYPIQADGEPIVASRIEVDILPGALQVWHPTRQQDQRNNRLLVAPRLATVGLFNRVEVLVIEPALARAQRHLSLYASARWTPATLQLSAQLTQTARAILKLTTALARRHDNPRGPMLHTHRRVRRVHALPARTRRAKHLHLAIARQLLDRHLGIARIFAPSHLVLIHINTSPHTKNVTKGRSLCHIAYQSLVLRA